MTEAGTKELTDEHAWWCGGAPLPQGLMRSPCTLLAGMIDQLPRSPRCPLVTNRQGRPAEAACRRCAAATNRLPATSAASLSACSLVPGRRSLCTALPTRCPSPHRYDAVENGLSGLAGRRATLGSRGRAASPPGSSSSKTCDGTLTGSLPTTRPMRMWLRPRRPPSTALRLCKRCTAAATTLWKQCSSAARSGTASQPACGPPQRQNQAPQVGAARQLSSSGEEEEGEEEDEDDSDGLTHDSNAEDAEVTD